MSTFNGKAWRTDIERRTAQIIGAHNLVAQQSVNTRIFAGRLGWMLIIEGLAILGIVGYLWVR